MHSSKPYYLYVLGQSIHNLNDEQDIQKIGGLFKALPFTPSSLIIGSLALTGTPYLIGFYFKALIIESANTSYTTNAWALTITLLATSLTAIYSTRIIFYALKGQPRFSTLNSSNENNPQLLNSIKRFLISSIFAGFILSYRIPPINVPVLTMPVYLKISALIITILEFIIAMELNLITLYLKTKMYSSTTKFSKLLGYFPTIIHCSVTYLNLVMSQKLSSTLLDLVWLEKAILKLIANLYSMVSVKTSNQKGLIKLYFLSFLISTLLAIITVLYFHV